MATAPLVEVGAPGLPADWLNAWLAAIGVTVLVPEVKLSWTDEVVPHAVFWVPEDMDLAQAVYDALPSDDELAAMPIARHHPESSLEFPHKVTPEVFRDRARLERGRKTRILAFCVTDLARYPGKSELSRSAFNPGVPGGLTLWERIKLCGRNLASPKQVDETLLGVPHRIRGAGLGFDCRKAPSGVPVDETKYIDPVIEVLVAAALPLFPVRGDGKRERTRGWNGRSLERGAFSWFSWVHPLDAWAIDAVLDQPSVVAIQWWRSVPFQPLNPSDTTRAIYSEPFDGGTRHPLAGT